MSDTDKMKKNYKQENGHDLNLIDKDDTFSFECTRCGRCCQGRREDIIINPYDVYKISKKLGISGEDLILKNCTIWLGNNSRVPIVGLSYNRSNGWCNFLDYDPKTNLFGCSINDVKPGACMNHPIGIIRQSDKSELQFLITEMCSHHAEKEQKVKEWIKPYLDELPEYNASAELMLYPRQYFNSILLCDIIQKKKNSNLSENDEIYKYPDSFYNNLFNIFVGITLKSLYTFDISRPFLDQIEDCKKNFNTMIDDVIELFLYEQIDLRNKKEDE